MSRRRTLTTLLAMASLASTRCTGAGGSPGQTSSGTSLSMGPPTAGDGAAADGPSSGGTGDSSPPDASAAGDGDVLHETDATDATLDAGDAANDAMGGGSDSSNAAGDASPGARDFSTDRTQFFGSSRCAQAGVQLCEGFETGALDKAIWTVQGTPPVVDGLEHARGNSALHVTQSGNGLSAIKETKTFPAVNDTYWGRIFVFFKTLPAAPLTYAHWTFVAASGTGVSGEIRLSGQFQNTANFFGVGTDNRVDDAGTGDWTNSDRDPPKSPMPVPLNQWLCIEWLHKGDTNETRFFWDGVEHPSLYTSATMHGGNTNPFLLPKFTNVWMGWQEYQTTTEPFELWIDEIAIDSARIGCVL